MFIYTFLLKNCITKIASYRENKSYVNCWGIKRTLSNAITFVGFEMISYSNK